MVIHRFYNAPRYGSKVPAFALGDSESGRTILLDDLLAEKPVVLLFGSYGCDVLRDSIEIVKRLHREHGDQCSFAMVYIREAHAFDGLIPDLAVAEDPKTRSERRALAQRMRGDFEIEFPILIDEIDDRTAVRWGAWPVRLFVIGRDGTVLYSGKPGPWGFSPGGGFEAELSRDLLPHKDRFSQESLEVFLARYREEKTE